MFLDVQRRNSLKRFVGLRKHRHIEPRIKWRLGFFPEAICLELSRLALRRDPPLGLFDAPLNRLPQPRVLWRERVGLVVIC